MIARRDHLTVLASRSELSPTCFRLALDSAARLDAEPGQFGMLACGDGFDPLLRRPFSLAGVRPAGDGSRIELLVKEVGRGSGLLRRMPLGTHLRFLAPLGNAFSLTVGDSDGGAPEDGREGDGRAGVLGGGRGSLSPVAYRPAGREGATLALVAGGIGLPPVLFAAEVLAARGVRFDCFLGAATAAELLDVERLRAAAGAVGGELVLATDDGSAGETGFVTAALARRLAAGRRYERALACGPTPMLAALTVLAREAGLEAELSLEEPMACGVGVCLSCVVELADGYRVPTCKEGPVFSTARLAPRWWM